MVLNIRLIILGQKFIDYKVIRVKEGIKNYGILYY